MTPNISIAILPANTAGWNSNFKGTRGDLALLSTIIKITSDTAPIAKGITKPIILLGSDPLFVIATRNDTSATAIVTIPLISNAIFFLADLGLSSINLVMATRLPGYISYLKISYRY